MKLTILLICVLCGIILFCLGMITASVYIGLIKEDSKEQKLQGLWLKNYDGTDVTQYINQNGKGNWVCVHISGMNLSDAWTVFQHEISHELISSQCQTNFTKCFERF